MNNIVTMGMFGGAGVGGTTIVEKIVEVEKIVYRDRPGGSSGGGGHVVLGGGSHTVKIPKIKLKKVDEKEKEVTIKILQIEENENVI